MKNTPCFLVPMWKLGQLNILFTQINYTLLKIVWSLISVCVCVLQWNTNLQIWEQQIHNLLKYLFLFYVYGCFCFWCMFSSTLLAVWIGPISVFMLSVLVWLGVCPSFNLFHQGRPGDKSPVSLGLLIESAMKEVFCGWDVRRRVELCLDALLGMGRLLVLFQGSQFWGNLSSPPWWLRF